MGLTVTLFGTVGSSLRLFITRSNAVDEREVNRTRVPEKNDYVITAS